MLYSYIEKIEGEENMNKFKKITSSLLALACGITLVACSNDTDEDDDQTDPSTEVTEASADEEADEAETTTSTEAKDEEETKEEETEATEEVTMNPDLDEDLYKTLEENVFTALVNFPAGTAGSSLKIAGISADFLNILSENKLDAESFLPYFEQFVSTLDKEDLGLLFDAWVPMEATITGIYQEDEVTLGIVEDAGKTLNDELIEQETWNEVSTKSKDVIMENF